MNLVKHTYMKTHRIVGILWMLFCGVPSIFFLWFLSQLYHSHPVVISTLDFDLAVLFCLLALAGALVSLPLYRGAVWARRFVSADGALSVIAAIIWLIVFRSLPPVIGIFCFLAIISVVLLCLPQHESVA